MLNASSRPLPVTSTQTLSYQPGASHSRDQLKPEALKIFDHVHVPPVQLSPVSSASRFPPTSFPPTPFPTTPWLFQLAHPSSSDKAESRRLSSPASRLFAYITAAKASSSLTSPSAAAMYTFGGLLPLPIAWACRVRTARMVASFAVRRSGGGGGVGADDTSSSWTSVIR